MKVNKPVLWVLIFCLICGIQTATAFSEEITYDTTSVVLNPIFRVLNIVDAPEDKDLTKDVTRAEFATIVAKLVNSNVSDSNVPDLSEFNDVSSNYYEAPYIDYVVQSGLMSVDNGSFYPTESVTSDTVIKTMVTVLGYSQYAIYAGNRSVDYLNEANRIDLLDGITLSETFSRADLYEMLNNILNIDIMDIRAVGEYKTYSVLEDTNVLKFYHKVQEAVGIVTANTFTGIYAINDAIDKGYISIDGKIFLGDYTDFLGMNIRYYYYDDGSNSVKSVLYAEPYENKILTLNGDDIVSSDNSTYVYYTQNNNKRNLDYGDATIIYNGVLLETGSVDMKPECGTVTLIDNNFDNSYDIVKIDNAQEMIVKTAYIDDKTIIFTGQYGDTFGCDSQKTVFYNTTTKSYVEKESINANQVLSIYASANGESTKIVISTESVNVSVGYKQKKDDKTIIRTKDGVEYTVSKNMNKLIESKIVTDIELGVNYTLYMNDRGEIAGVERAKAAAFGDWEYAFLINAVSKDVFSQGGDVEIKICSIMSSIDVYPLASRIKVDGKAVDEENVYKLLCKKGEKGVVKEKIQPQLIRIKINSELEVTDIDLAGEANADGDLYMSFTGDYMWYEYMRCEAQHSGIVGFKKPISTSETPYVFCVPRDDAGNIDNTQEELFSCRSINYLVDGETYSVEQFKLNSKDYGTNVIVMDVPMENGKPKALYNKNLCLYLGQQSIYEDEQVLSQIRFMENGVEKTATLDDSIDLTKLQIRKDNTADGVTEANPTELYSINEGDLFIYATDPTGKVNDIRVGYDSTNDRIIGINSHRDPYHSDIRWTASAEMFMVPFYLLAQDNSFVIYTPFENYESSVDGKGNLNLDWNTMYSEQTTVFYSSAYVYNRKYNTVETINKSVFENPLKFAVDGGGASKIITWKRYGIINAIYFYE